MTGKTADWHELAGDCPCFANGSGGNGLLLAPHLDAAFDQGFITFRDDGALVTSPALDATARGLLGLDRGLRLRSVAAGHAVYLRWHRERVFRGGA